MSIEKIHENLLKLGNKEKAEQAKKYLKSPYSFYGIKIPNLKKLAKDYKNLDFSSTANLFETLWNSGNHEEMSLGLFLLEKFAKSNPDQIWKIVIKNIEKAKTWDHIDEISPHILGEILNNNYSYSQEIKEMSENKNPWIRRASIVSTYPLIKNSKIELTLRLAEKLAYDKDIYVQKGAGWMLRELGKKNRLALREFLLMHLDMKSIAFSYATEKMKEVRKIKQEYLKKKKEEKKKKIIS